jgi:hypothetical protein
MAFASAVSAQLIEKRYYPHRFRVLNGLREEVPFQLCPTALCVEGSARGIQLDAGRVQFNSHVVIARSSSLISL